MKLQVNLNPSSIALPRSTPWPRLTAMLAAKRIGAVDLLLAEHLLKEQTMDNEGIAAFICHLSAAAQQGHLCVTIADGTIIPSPEDVWVSKKQKEPSTESNEFNLSDLIIQGSLSIDPSLLSYSGSSKKLTPIYRDENTFYFQRNWVLQSHFIKQYRRRLQDEIPSFSVDMSKIHNLVTELKNQGTVLEEQAKAIIQGAKSCLTFIIGGPGTGKTYTAGLLLRTLWNCFDSEVKKMCKVVVTAPTGKAASHLEKSISAAMGHSADQPQIQGQTLHSLLGVKGHRQVDRHLYCNADIIIVDECSMIDVWMMGDLMGALKQGSRLVLLGDPGQLPSVESGSLFADLVSYHLNENKSHQRVIELKTCQRTELKEIVEFAAYIRAGNSKKALSVLSWNQTESVISAKAFESKSSTQIQQALVKFACSLYPFIREKAETPAHMMQSFLQFRVLSPLREGSLGVDELNQKIYQACHQRAQNASSFAVPIMITKNDPRMNLFNGDMGILIQPIENSHTDVYAYFNDRSDETGFRKIHASTLPPYEFAYCLSVHKSQGSEFNSILLVVPEGAEVFGREALYTAVTRAKATLSIWSSQETLTRMIVKQSIRHSGVVKALTSLTKKESE